MSMNGGKAFLDSGTTYAYFGKELFDNMVATFDNFCAKKHSNCGGQRKFKSCFLFDRSKYRGKVSHFFKGFPLLSFEFGPGGVVDWHPEDYLVEKVTPEGVFYCPGIKKLNHVIFGATFMRNYDIYFDKVARKITFARANCENSPRFSEEQNEKDRRLKISTTLSPAAARSHTTVSADGMISLTDKSAASSPQASDGTGANATAKLIPDFIGLQQAPVNATNTTADSTAKSPTFLFYYVIIFVFLVLFLIILMLRLMM